MITSFWEYLHDFIHWVSGINYPHEHRWLDVAAALVFIIAPSWTGWLALRAGLRWAKLGLRRRARWRAIAAARRADPDRLTRPGLEPPREDSKAHPLEAYVMRATLRFQLRLIAISVLALPAAWLLLEVPKHIINHALTDANGNGHPGMTFLGFSLARLELLFALCASYFAVLTASGLVKFAANHVRGRVNERVVRRLRLAIMRRARLQRSPEHRATLAAVAVQEVEPIGYFAGSLMVVPLIQGGTLLTSILFLFFQNTALALAALIMLPVQLTLLPRLQGRLNATVRERVYATRALGRLLTVPSLSMGGQRDASPLHRQMRQTKELERLRIEINDQKGRVKGLYNYTSNLTPFFFFAIGGYLVVQGQLSLGALVAALAAYKEIAPALRELFDFAQNWSDARARFEEVNRTLSRPLRYEDVSALKSSGPATAQC